MSEQEIIPEETQVSVPNDDAQAAPEAQDDGAALEAEASRYGWKPKEKWKGDTTHWVDAKTYVERARDLLPVIKGQLADEREAREREARDYAERLERIERASAQAMERQKALMAAEIERARQEALSAKRDMDFDRFEAATKRAADLERQPIVEPPKPQVDPVVREWLDKTPVLKDPTIARMLPALGDEAVRYGFATPAEQVDYAERRLKVLFPEKFEAPKPQRTFAPVDGGSLTVAKPRRSASDLPADARRIGEQQVKEGLWKDLGEYAEAYWSA